MSDYRRFITEFIDVSNGYPVLSATDLSRKPQQNVIYPSTQIILRFHLLTSASASFTPPADATWLFGVNNTFSGDPPHLVIADTSDFNHAEDWELLSPTSGKVCCRVDLTDPQFTEAASSLTSMATWYANLWMSPAGQKPVLVCQWEVSVMPIAINPTVAAKTSGIVHVTTDMANASYVPILGDQARWRWRDGGWQYLFADDSKWRQMLPKLVDGEPVIGWGDPED